MQANPPRAAIAAVSSEIRAAWVLGLRTMFMTMTMTMTISAEW